MLNYLMKCYHHFISKKYENVVHIAPKSSWKTKWKGYPRGLNSKI